MAALVDVDKMTHEDAAKKWLADNKSQLGKLSLNKDFIKS